MATSRDRLVEVAAYDSIDEAQAAVAFLADDAVDARIVDDGTFVHLVVASADANRARVLLGLPVAPAAAAPSAPDDGDVRPGGEDGDWEAPLSPSSMWRKPPWMRAVVVLVVAGMLIPAVLSLVSVLTR
ncbi:MAG: hypothetical protein WHS89_02150 [Acidimicrobiales bacterium]